jgi:SanA protein
MKNDILRRKHRPFLLKHKIITGIIILFTLLIVIVFFNHYSIQRSAKNLIYNKIENVPHRKTAVLLGMEKKFTNGKLNRFYINRIDATVNLYNAKKIDIIIVSRNQGNVVNDVKRDLIKRGIPKNKIILDYAGLRTYDSMYRMYKVYGQKKFIVIAQKKQNERAIYIAKKNGLNAIAFNAGEYSGYNSFRLNMIEKLERTRLFFEFLVNKKPKYSGEKVTIAM